MKLRVKDDHLSSMTATTPNLEHDWQNIPEDERVIFARIVLPRQKFEAFQL